MLENQLTLHMWINQIGTKSFGFQYQLVDRSAETIVYATGESVQVFFDYGKNSSMEIPEGLRESLAEYLPGWYRQASQKKDECYAYLFSFKWPDGFSCEKCENNWCKRITNMLQVTIAAK